MNIETGEIRDLSTGPGKQGEILISDIERQYLEKFKPEERPELLKELRSKNNNAKRRARKKIAKASRQRNRR
jgi:hypothetical protein